ncbi:RidA family protein [Futiania mangrovi]|uniref:RidA family protein n=1 Tax=Futiania mangrovi TaxID=2959716 RepID=A0A9J6PGH9_9PROT|nr:RidA family protein [Futiania mangrovii]MCP1337849.1 RidA family protein [Futiania mangrovii]
MTLETRAAPSRAAEALAAAGLDLPEPHVTEFDYIPVAVHGTTAYVAGQIPKTGANDLLHAGRVGAEVTAEQAFASARLAALQGLAWVDARAGGLDNVERVLRMDVFVAADDGFRDISRVADAASRVLIHAFGEAGRHPRSVLGVSQLPRNAPVLLEMTLALRKPVAAQTR